MGGPSIVQGLVLGLLMFCPGLAFTVDIRADSNRDGVVDVEGIGDLPDKLEWSDAAGAIFLANIGDTHRRCSKLALARPPSEEGLAACNDAADDVQRSPQHMAQLKTVPVAGIGDDAWGTVGVREEISRKNVRIFRREAGGWAVTTNDHRFPASQLRQGLELGIDARDTRRPAGWDGRVEVRFDVQDGRESSYDVVRLRVAPVITFHHLMPVSEVLATNGNESGSPYQARFVSDLQDILGRPDLQKPLFLFNHSDDVWAQDILEPAYTSMLGPGGPVKLEVMIRSPQGSRVAGRQVFEYLRNASRGAVYSTGGIRDEIDSTGNLETIPPYSFQGRSYPSGRVIQGSHGAALPHLYDYMRAQELQDPIILDVDWLAVGHVDEIVQFLPAAGTLHGWALFIADPMGGIQILEKAQADGHGGPPAFSRANGTVPSVRGDVPGDTIDQIVTQKLKADNRRFAQRIDAVKEVLRRATGIPDDDVHAVPMVFTTGFCFPPDEGVSPERNCSAEHGVALYPGVLNGVVLSDSQYLAPNPWGPAINGVDVMAQATDRAYGQVGFKVVYIDDWYSHHEGGGEVHCGTNTIRVPSQEWWRTRPERA